MGKYLSGIRPLVFLFGCLAVATTVRALLTPLWGPGYAYITYFPAVMLITAAFGWFYGVLATGIAALLSMTFFLQSLKDPSQLAALLMFFGVNLVIIAAAERTQREKKRANQALREREAELDILVNRTPFLLTRCTRDLRYKYVSKAYANMLGKRAEEIVDKPIVEIMGEAGFQTILPYIEQVLKGQSVEYEADISFKDRGIRSLRVHYTPEKDSQENAVGWIASIVDITEHKKVQEQLDESESRFRIMADTAPVLVWMSDTTKSCTWFNKPWLEFTGRTLEQEVGNGWAESVHLEDFGPCLHTYMSAFDARQPFTMEYRLRRHDGVYRWVLDTGVPRYSENGAFLGYIGSCIDVTERKALEDRLSRWNKELELRVTERTQEMEDAHRRLRTLASELNLAEQRERRRLATELHDHLQQMLVLGKLNLGQAKRHLAPSSPTRRLIENTELTLATALQYTRTLVADLSPPVLRDCGLAAALQWLSDYMKKYDLTVSVSVPEPLPPSVPEDQSVLLFQSVRELIINVAKHGCTREVWVTLQALPQRLVIQVKDCGMGFDPRIVTALKNGEPKFGLLAIRERMMALGGSFEIVSSPGKGTLVTLSLPVKSVEVNVPKPVLSSKRRTSLLLVDDHAMVRQFLRTQLQLYDDLEIVGEATNGEEAIAVIEQLRPQVVVMDVSMPKRNGIEATAEIKARYPETIVIGITVTPGGNEEQVMLKAGAATVITKEAAIDQLHRKIAALLDS